jgi:response regulator RpfG family c-di-GMP phosphodiesterase
MKVLLIENDLDVRDILWMALESYMHFTVMATDNAEEAIHLLQKSTDIACIISDYHLKSGTGGDVYQFVTKSEMKLPFLLCSSENPRTLPEFDGFDGENHIEKPFRLESFIKKVKNLIKEVDSFAPQGEAAQYCPLRVSTLLRVNLSDCDLYVRLSDYKFVKLVQMGDGFTQEDVSRYSNKNVEFLYFHVKDSVRLLNKLTSDVMSLSKVKHLPAIAAFEGSHFAHETMHQVSSTFGFTNEAHELAKTCTDLALRAVYAEPNITPYLDKLQFDRGNFLTTHSLLVSHLACLFASLLGWASQITQYKLALAAVLHDLTLENDSVALTELSIKLSVSHGEISKTMISKHPRAGSELIQKMREIPGEVDLIILSHHERPDGSGFPNQMDGYQISGLASVFIVAHDFANYLWLKDQQATLKSFLDIFKDEYQAGTFKKIHTALEQISHN